MYISKTKQYTVLSQNWKKNLKSFVLYAYLIIWFFCIDLCFCMHEQCLCPEGGIKKSHCPSARHTSRPLNNWACLEEFWNYSADIFNRSRHMLRTWLRVTRSRSRSQLTNVYNSCPVYNAEIIWADFEIAWRVWLWIDNAGFVYKTRGLQLKSMSHIKNVYYLCLLDNSETVSGQ